MKCIEIINQCDVNYRTSNNKRLIVELALMQMHMLNPSETASAAADPQKKTPDVEVSDGIGEKKAVFSDLKPIELSNGKPPATIISGKNISIKIDKQEIVQPAVKKETPETIAEESPVTYNFTEDELITAWEEMIQSFEDESPSFISALSNHQPALTEEFEIIQTVDNNLQMGEINLRRQEICEFIKSRLNITSVRFNVTVNEEHTKELIYSPIDKFKQMAEKNPALIQFKNELNLELDY